MNKVILSVISSCLLLCSCSESILDLKPYGAPGEGTFLETESDLKMAVNGLYYRLWDDWGYSRGPMWWICASDDMIPGRSNGNADNTRNFVLTYTSEVPKQWFYHIRLLARANAIIRSENKIAMSNEWLHNFYIGQAYFLGAFMHFELARRYADMVEGQGFPIPDRENQMNLEVPRAKNVNVNYDYIIADLNEAAKRLPYFGELSAEDYGRPTKTAAWAVASKVCLYKAWNCHNTGDEAGARASFEEAVRYATLVIEAQYGGKKCHDLAPTYKDVFLVKNNYGPEYIFSAVGGVYYATAQSRPCMLPGMMLENKGWGKYNGFGYFQPTKELYDEFEPGDQRRAVTILAPGDTFTYFGEERVYDAEGTKSSSTTKMQFNKFMDPFAIGYSELNPNGDSPSRTLNVPIIRYAEVLLIRAEAKIMLGESAKEDLDAIRKRAGLEPKSSYSLEDLKHERRCELAAEFADRHGDLIRWGDAQATYAKPAHGFTGNQVWPGRTFDPKIHHIYPFPENQLLMMEGRWKQNYGY